MIFNALIIIGFGQLRWFRRRIGGRWECYWNQMTWSAMWFHGEPEGYRPIGCMGSPTVENYDLPEAKAKW